MKTIRNFLSGDHHACDIALAAAEASAADEEWEAATTEFAMFRTEVMHHFAREEDILFPRFEARAGGLFATVAGGPTQVMRNEHKELRALIEELERLVHERQRDEFLDNVDTFFTLIQQHNIKEEEILYLAADQVLEDERASLLESMCEVNVQLPPGDIS